METGYGIGYLSLTIGTRGVKGYGSSHFPNLQHVYKLLKITSVCFSVL